MNPFIVIENFISPLECENIVREIELPMANYNGNSPIKSSYQNKLIESRLLERIEYLIDDIENHYDGYVHRGVLPVNIEHYPENCVLESYKCDGYFKNSLEESSYTRKSDIDFTTLIFLKDSVTTSEFDEMFEVYGASIQFPKLEGNIIPKRGECIVFPSHHKFVYRIIPPQLCDLYLLKLNFVGDTTYKFNPQEYKGNLSTWI